MSDNQLIIYPVDPMEPAPGLEELVAGLLKIGLIGRKMDGPGENYEQGYAFQDFVRFASSHTAVIVDRDEALTRRVDSREICWIEVSRSDGIEVICSGITGNPVCKGCGAEGDWGEICGECYENPEAYRYRCVGCGKEQRAWELDWKREAAFARFSIGVWGVKPEEAEPTGKLLGALRESFKREFDFIYYRL